MISPQLTPAYDTLTAEFAGQYKDLGDQVLWIWRNGVLTKRYIAGTNILSQHVGGNAWDVAPLTQSTANIAKIDRMVVRAEALGCKVLWRGVRNHFPHHAHIEGRPKYTQTQLHEFYEEDDDVKELIAEIQHALIDCGYDLGDFTPLPGFPPGCDGEMGAKTRAAMRQAWGQGGGKVPDHKHPQIGVTGVPI